MGELSLLLCAGPHNHLHRQKYEISGAHGLVGDTGKAVIMGNWGKGNGRWSGHSKSGRSSQSWQTWD